MIVLIGPSSWNARVKRLLTDRTNHSLHQVISINAPGDQQGLLGVAEHIELVVCEGLYVPTFFQQDVIALVHHLNSSWERK